MKKLSQRQLVNELYLSQIHSSCVPILFLYPNPCSPLASFSKFSTVLGRSFPNRPSTILPVSCPPMLTSRKTLDVTSPFEGSFNSFFAALAGGAIFSAGVAIIHIAAPMKPAVMMLLIRPRREIASTTPLRSISTWRWDWIGLTVTGRRKEIG